MAQDLSLIHEPIGDFLSDIDRTLSDAVCELTAEQIKKYREEGFLSGIDVLSPSQCDQLCAELADITLPDHAGREYWYEYHVNESQTPETVLFHALGAWRVRPGLHDILWHPRFNIPASQLLEGDVRFWHDQLFCKPANHGGVVAWHQDYSYWTRTQPMSHLTCWIALDDATCDNGCVQYIPGSHQWDLLPVTGLAGDMNAIREVLSDDQWRRFQEPVPAVLARGQAVFHHPLMIHGSNANRTAGPRRAVVLNVIRDGVKSASDQPLLAGVPVVAPGDQLNGQFFPLLRARES
ncbi:MAG: phytanoyl-CoA dioxygenase family protein [Planctomycetota bacterium]|nr:phytanoyl-CoA dioxygenase family protein [Planctomycetota bacterium]